MEKPDIRVINGHKIRVDFVYPPIPIRTCDYSAYYDDDEPDDDGHMAAGSGSTAEEAIADLLESYPRDPA